MAVETSKVLSGGGEAIDKLLLALMLDEVLAMVLATMLLEEGDSELLVAWVLSTLVGLTTEEVDD